MTENPPTRTLYQWSGSEHIVDPKRALLAVCIRSNSLYIKGKAATDPIMTILQVLALIPVCYQLDNFRTAIFQNTYSKATSQVKGTKKKT